MKSNYLKRIASRCLSPSCVTFLIINRMRITEKSMALHALTTVLHFATSLCRSLPSQLLVYSLMECVRSCDQKPYWHNETKGGICIKIEFNPQKNNSLLQHGRSFFVYFSNMAAVTSCEHTLYDSNLIIFFALWVNKVQSMTFSRTNKMTSVNGSEQ